MERWKKQLLKNCEKGIKSAKPAELDYWFVDSKVLDGKEVSLLKIKLKTGGITRSVYRWQVMAHLCGEIVSIILNFRIILHKGNVALFASGLSFIHPKTKRR